MSFKCFDCSCFRRLKIKIQQQQKIGRLSTSSPLLLEFSELFGTFDCVCPFAFFYQITLKGEINMCVSVCACLCLCGLCGHYDNVMCEKWDTRAPPVMCKALSGVEQRNKAPLVESGCGSSCVRQSVLLAHQSVHPILRRKSDGHVPDIRVRHIVLTTKQRGHRTLR